MQLFSSGKGLRWKVIVRVILKLVFGRKMQKIKKISSLTESIREF